MLLQWRKFQLLLKGNRFKKTPPVLESKLVETLDLTLYPASEAAGGFDADDFAQMTILDSIAHLRVRICKGVRLLASCGSKPYYQHLASLGKPSKTADAPSSITRLSIHSPIPQPLDQCFQLTAQFPNLKHLVLDNVQGLMGIHPILALPHLTSFTLRNPVNLQFTDTHGFAFLAGDCKLKSLALHGCEFDKVFLRHVLLSQKDSLETLVLGIMPLISCPNRWELRRAHEEGSRSLDTGWHVPIQYLDDPVRVGDEAARICRKLTSLALGGILCISPKLLDILNEPDRVPLHSLSLHDAGRLRPTRPDGDDQAKRETELLEAHPSGISPRDLLDAFEAGFYVARMSIRGMGHEWQEGTAEDVKVACDVLGIALVS